MHSYTESRPELHPIFHIRPNGIGLVIQPNSDNSVDWTCGVLLHVSLYPDKFMAR